MIERRPRIEASPAPAGTDWTEVHALLMRAFAFMEGRIDPPSSLLRLTPEGLAEKATGETCLLARRDGRLAGCIFCTGQENTLYIGKLAVDPEVQREGIGRFLVATAEALARSREHAALVLQTRVELVENHAAFAAMGFAKIAETAHPGFDRPTSITMRKDLHAAVPPGAVEGTR